MFARLGRFAADHTRSVLTVAVLLMIGAAALGLGAFGKLQSQGFTDPHAESSQAQQEIAARFGGDADLVFLVRARAGTVDDDAIRAAGIQLTAKLAAERELTGVISYWQTGAGPLKSGDSSSALILAHAPAND